jgi:hypothetical protein
MEESLELIAPPGLKDIKQVELWEKWGAIIGNEEARKKTCPKPADDVIERIRSKRRKKRQDYATARDPKKKKKEQDSSSSTPSQLSGNVGITSGSGGIGSGGNHISENSGGGNGDPAPPNLDEPPPPTLDDSDDEPLSRLLLQPRPTQNNPAVPNGNDESDVDSDDEPLALLKQSRKAKERV